MVSRNRKYDSQELEVQCFPEIEGTTIKAGIHGSVCKELELRIYEIKGNKAKRLRGCGVVFEKLREGKEM